MTDQTDKLVEWVENLGNIVAGEIPPFIQEVVRYGIVSNIVGVILCFMLATVLTYVSVKYFDKLEFFSLILGFLGVMSSIAGISCVDGLMKATFAPKLYVIHMLKDKN